MSDPSDYFRPLCPTHYSRMVLSPNLLESATLPKTWEIVAGHDCECPVDDCAQHYSPGYGYFTLESNEEHRSATGSPSFRINRSSTQVICGEHEHSMFLESFHSETNLQKFRCPQRDCQQTMEILAGAAPAYWLGEDYFRTR